MARKLHSVGSSRRGRQTTVWTLALVFVLCVTQGAYADLASGLTETSAYSTPLASLPAVLAPAHSCIVPDEQAGASAAEPVIDLHKVAALLIPPAADRLRAGMPIAADGLPQGQASQQVKDLPPPPSSLTVALSSLATFGAWRLVRNAKQVHIGSLPEWYHTGGPSQVGHATPFLLDLNPSMLPLCWYEHTPILDIDSKPTPQGGWWKFRTHFKPQWFVPTIASRGPPASF